MSAGPPARGQTSEAPLLVVLSGPSGVGKDAVLNRLRSLVRPWHFVVTATTRTIRPAERDGTDYIFMEKQKFQDMVRNGELLEHAQVYDNWYGVPRQQVREALDKGLDTILKVDVQGAATIKSLAPEAVFIFLTLPTMEELQQRLVGRDTESEETLRLRSGTARQETERLTEFDYRVINANGRLEEAIACIDAIILAEKCRIPPRRISI